MEGGVHAIARTYFLRTDEGGRTMPTPPDKHMCIFAFEGELFSCRLILDEIGARVPGSSADIPITFVFPHLIVPRLKAGDKFYLREGNKIAEGEIIAML